MLQIIIYKNRKENYPLNKSTPLKNYLDDKLSYSEQGLKLLGDVEK